MKRLALAIVLASIAVVAPRAAAPKRLLFIGNSFTFGELSPVHFWKNGSVTDLNDEGVGGVPALVKAMTVQAGLDYDVSKHIPASGLTGIWPTSSTSSRGGRTTSS